MEERAREQPVIKGRNISRAKQPRDNARRRFPSEISRSNTLIRVPLGEGYSFRRLIAGRVHATRRGRRNDQA